MFFIIFLLFSFLYSCDTSSMNSAYKDYNKYQRLYISSILENDKNNQKKALKNIIECGRYLNINITTYEKKYQELIHKKHFSKYKKEHIIPTTYYKKQIKYIKIISKNPFIVTIPNNQIKHFVLKKRLNVFDIPNAVISKHFYKTINHIKIRVAQFNKKTVRVVVYSKKINFEIKNKKLIIYLQKEHKKLTSLILPKAYKQKIIVVDPGHGGKDSGGIGIGGKMEKVAVLEIAKKVKYYLQKEGYKVYLTRDRDIFRKLRWRTHFANIHHADLFISIHCNITPNHSTATKGITTYFLSPTRDARAIRVAKLENKEIKGLNYIDQRLILGFLNHDRIIASQKFGIDVQAGMLYSLRKKYKDVIDRGVRPAPFWVLVGTQMPAILIETGFLTNPMEAKRLFNSNYQTRLAKGIAIGVYNYFQKNP